MPLKNLLVFNLKNIRSYITYLFLLFVIFTSSFVGVNVFAQIPSPIARYEMNNSSSDISGNQNHGKINGNVKSVDDRFGRPCSALYFDGKSGFIEVPSSKTLESIQNKFSFTVWYKLPKVSTPMNWLTILCKGTGSIESPTNPQYRFQVQQNTDLQQNPCSPYISSPFSTISINTEFTECDDSMTQHLFEQDVWHFYALIYDGNQVKAFMDGKKIFEHPYFGIMNFNSDQLLIGKDIPGSTEYFHGILDDLQIYSQALTELQVIQLYQLKPNIVSPEDNLDVSYPASIEASADKGKCNTKVNFQSPIVDKSCYPYVVSQIEGPVSGSLFSVGDTRITFKVSSNPGASIYNTFYVRVADEEDPILQVQADTIVYLENNKQNIKLTFKNPIATDNCKVKLVEQLSGKKSGDLFDEGEHLVSYRAQDYSGNIAFETFKIRVEKKLTPKFDSIVVRQDIPRHDTTVVFVPDDKYDSLSVNTYKQLNIVLLVDISNSMSENQRLEKLKESVKAVLKNLRNSDNVSIVTFSSNTSIIKPLGPNNNKPFLIALIDSLKPSGATEFAPGIEAAFNLLENNYNINALNHIFLFTDGLFTMTKSQEKSFKQMALNKKNPIGFSIFNIVDRYGILALQDIAKSINGTFLPISNLDDARKVSLEHLKQLSEVK